MGGKTTTYEDLAKAAGIAVPGTVTITNLFTNQQGPLPITKAFDTSGGKLLVFVSGSLSTGDRSLLAMNIDFDESNIGTCQQWINVNSHFSLIPVLLSVTDAKAGQHKIKLSAGNGKSDFNDYYNVTVIEFSN